MATKLVNGKRVELSAEEEAAIQAEWAANEAEQAANAWKKNRKKELPSIEEQLADLYKAMDSGKLPSDNDFYLKRKAIYDKYPEPQGGQ